MAAGDPGQVVVAATTWGALGAGKDGLALGPTRVKGKRAPVDAWILRAAP
jgi:class 3 adenylate cyclase